MTGIPRCTVRDWRREGNSYTRKRQKPGPKPGSTRGGEVGRVPPCPMCHGAPLDEPEYAYLFGLYLGDGHIARLPRTLCLRITCALAYPRIIDECERAIH